MPQADIRLCAAVLEQNERYDASTNTTKVVVRWVLMFPEVKRFAGLELVVVASGRNATRYELRCTAPTMDSETVVRSMLGDAGGVQLKLMGQLLEQQAAKR